MLVKLNDVNRRIITVRGEKVILDCDVAELYGVATNDINQAVKRNPDKFPEGYIINLSNDEKSEVATICGNLKIKYSPAIPKAFTERGLYMLATILKSSCATQTTIAIIDTFTKIRDLSRQVAELVKAPQDESRQQAVAQKSNSVLSDIINNDLETVNTETSYELNLLSAIKIRHTERRTRYEKRNHSEK